MVETQSVSFAGSQLVTYICKITYQSSMVFGNHQGGSNSSHPEMNPSGEVRYDWAGANGEIFDESSMRRRTADEEEKMDRHRTKYIVGRRGIISAGRTAIGQATCAESRRG